MKSMALLQNIIKETLRLHAPGKCRYQTTNTNSLARTRLIKDSVGFNIRTALRDTTLPTGGGATGKGRIGVLKGTHVGSCPPHCC